MKERSWLENFWIAFDYGYLLPALARLPVPLGRGLATLRGLLYARLQRDWRQFTFNDQALHGRTQQALKELMPNADAPTLARALRARYVMQSLDELEACWLSRKDLKDWPIEYVGLEPILEAIKTHGRIVFVTAHYASCVLGVVHLRRLGIPILAMTSSVTEDPRVHPSISHFYRKRKEFGGLYLNGGQVLDREGNARYFVKFLRNGGAVVIFGELPPSPNEEPLTIPFLGKERELAPGPDRLAKLVDAPLFSFVCEYTRRGFRVTFSPPDTNPYALIEKHIQNNPSAWWAADLLPLLPLCTKQTTDRL